MTAHAQPRGFTLIELMVALAIVALLLFLGMPSFSTFVRNSEIRSTAESIINGLRAANTTAANRNGRVTFEFTTPGSADWQFWALEEDGVTRTTFQTYAKKEAGSSSRIILTPAGPLSVVFTGLGRVEVDPLNPDNHIRQIDITSVIAGEARPLRIIVDDPTPADPTRPRGLRMCDPGVAVVVPPDPRAC